MFTIIANENYSYGIISHFIGIWDEIATPENVRPVLAEVAEAIRQDGDALHWSLAGDSISIKRGNETPWTISAVWKPSVIAQYIRPLEEK